MKHVATALAAAGLVLAAGAASSQTIRCNPGENASNNAVRCKGQLQYNESLCAQWRPTGLDFNSRGRGRFQRELHGTIDINGSTTVRPSSDRIETYFRLFNDKVTINDRALGSTTGIRSVIEGACAEMGLDPNAGLGDVCDQNNDGRFDEAVDIGQSSREIRNIELARANDAGLCVVEHPVALDGLGITVHPSVRACAGAGAFLTQNDIRNIYLTNTISDWGLLFPACAGLPVRPVSRTREGGTFGSFVDLYLGGTNPSGGTFDPFAPQNPNVVHVGSNDEIVAYASATPGGVGYAGIAFIAPLEAASAIHNMPVTKSLAVPATPATFENVATGKFQFSRLLYNYTIGSPDPLSVVGQYLAFYLSPWGQVATFDAGFVPTLPINPIAQFAQKHSEPYAQQLFALDVARIAEKQAVIAAAQELIDDPMTPAQVRADAITDKTESIAAISEFVSADRALARRTLDRAAAACGGPVATAEALFASANAKFAATDYAGALSDLAQAVAAAQASENGCI